MAHGLDEMPTAKTIDTVLNAERRGPKPIVQTADLPDGAMVGCGTEARLIIAGAWHQWSFDGYGPAEAPWASQATLLTPASIMATIKAGYQPVMAI